MKLYKKIKIILFFLFLLCFAISFAQSNTNFTVILDAGHGGKDPGNSYHGFVEKEIALKTTLKLEKYLIRENIKVIHTRKTDVFIELVDRPKKANSSHANLFVSIHCNSVKNPVPFGTETFVMGLTRSKGNLEIAKQENSVILLEKNYKQTYKGFDPKNPETLIGLKMMQEDYLDRSIVLASKIESNFKNDLKRKSRGIKQTPLWVLDAAYMPSVLIELGFLSNNKEGSYLNSNAGQEAMAKAIAAAIIDYKKEYFGSSSGRVFKNSVDAQTNEKTKNDSAKFSEPKISENQKSNLVFKIQFAAGKQDIPLKSYNFKGLSNVSMRTSNGTFFKYSYGETLNYGAAKKDLDLVQSKGYPSAYIIAFKNGKNIPIKEALK
ncbi:N-acetylmuramoyl-L-alanine amidase [Flavobacterium micromati]|uniref:N-acetylmuramoyl-L-alanine amidase n=1 Tax=Flavobacterium micromati TaxID=229205 RepID=A0A1M5Q8F5_9FLAO|nr:N-acetylmuramoyl-L-alanine amidase [Flavobacterium micromati]SHH10454.1 N-acetylmuramoyl-L-alanine amidase [Flavobacterium micromati]